MNHRQSLNRLVVLAGLAIGLGAGLPSAHAASYSWTNTANTASDFWTNGVNWGTQTTNSPGSAPGSSAYLTNQLTGTYTNILDTALANSVNLLAISNALGEVWLVVTNNGSGLTNSIFKLGSGGRVEINNGGVIAGITNFTWVGTNGAIILNAGGKLFTATGITIDSGTTGLISSLSAAGQGGVWNLNSNAWTVGSAQSFNSVTINNATLTNVGTVTIGAGANSAGNSLTLSNGASFFSGNVTIGNASGASNNAVNIGGLGVASTAGIGNVYVGGASTGPNGNTLTVTNATVTSKSLYIGFGGGNSNTVTVLANTLWNAGGVGWLAMSTVGDTLTVNGGVLTNFTRFYINGANDTVTLTNGAQLFNVTGATFPNRLGETATSSSNTVNVLAGSLWADTTGQGLTISPTVGEVSNLLLVNGGTYSNVSSVTIGGSTSGLIVTNGRVVVHGLQIAGANDFITILSNGTLATTIASSAISLNGGVTMTVDGGTVTGFGNGVSMGGVGNNLLVTNGGQLLLPGGGVALSGVSNTMNFANATIASGNLSVGGNNGDTNNTLTVSGTSTWNGGNSLFFVGAGTASGNSLTISGATVTNFNRFLLRGVNNTVTLTNNGQLFINWGGTAGGIGLGATDSSNTLRVLAGGNYSDGNNFTISSGGGVSNLVLVSGGTFTNTGTLGINGAASGLLVTNGKVFVKALTLAGATNDFVTVLANATLAASSTAFNTFTVGGGVLTINGGTLTGFSSGGTVTGTGNSLQVINGGQLLGNGGLLVTGLSNTVTVANATVTGGSLTVSGAGNLVSVLTGGTWSVQGSSLTVGSGAATGNVLLIDGGNVVGVSRLTVGTTTNSVGNSVLVRNGGLLEANVLSNFVGGTGNTISNVGGIYQFTTNAPGITPNGTGNIAINNGTISFRAITNANVYGNWGGASGSQLTNIAFSGNNTFQLNAASNTASGVSQTYTFDTGRGATNYANLALVNGQTAYRNGDVTIGTGGSLLVSNTSATLTGLVTNNGTAGVVNSSASFNKGLVNAGTVAIQNATISGGITNLAGGTIHGSGTMTGGNVFNAGTLSLAGGQTLTLNNLTLTSTANSVLLGNGGTIIFNAASFYNNSTNNLAWNLGAGSTLVFSNGVAVLSAASADLGANFASTNKNFFVANLNLTGGVQLNLATNTAGHATLYVGALTLASGTTLNLDGSKVYYAGSLTTNGATINLDGGELMPLTDVTVSAITVAPGTETILVNRTQQFNAAAYDLNGQPTSGVAIAWSVAGGGTIDSNGLFTAGNSAGGPYTVSATAGGTNGAASVTITIDTEAPVISLNGSNPQSIEMPGGYVEAGATATDDWDGNLTGSISIDASALHANQLGTYLVRYTVADSSGNIATNNRTVIVQDTIRPTLSATVSPAPNAAGWNQGSVTVTFHAADTGSGIASVTSPVTVTNEGAGQTITGTAIDNAGNSTNLTVTVNVDLTAPTVTLSPTDGATVTNNQPSLVASFSDALSGIGNSPVTMLLDGADVTSNSTITSSQATFTPTVPLAFAAHTWSATVTDIAGNSSTVTTSFTVLLAGTPGSVGWWQFDEGSGTSVADSSVNSNTGALFNGPNWVGGIFSNALSFNTNQWVSITAAPVYDLTDALSISLWLYLPATQANGPTPIVSKGDGITDGLIFGLTDGQAMSFAMTATNGNGLVAPLSTPTNVWTHVVATFDGTNATLYLNSVLVTNQLWSGNRLVNTNALVLGNPSSNGVPVVLDDVRLYNYALSTNQIAALYNASTAGDGLPNWWAINNGLNPNDPTVATQTNANPWAHGLTNLQVYQNPSVLIADNYSTLNDGLPDWWKVSDGLSLSDSNVVSATNTNLSWANGTNNLAAYQLSLIPPTITATITPAPNAAGWNNTNVLVHFSANSTGSGIAWVTPDITITGSTNDCDVVGWAMDNAGNPVSTSVILNIDQTPPVITLDPGAGQTLDQSHPLLLIQYADSDTNVPPVTVFSGLDLSSLQILLDGNNVTTNFYVFAAGAVGNGSTLAAGTHTWSATIADLAGNVTSTSVTFTATGAPNANAPVMANLDLNESGVTVLPDMAEVWVQGKVSGDGTTVAASVNGGEPVLMNQRGEDFGYLLPLEPGTNVIVLVATAAAQPQQQARRRRQGAADNEQQAKSSNMLIMERSTRYPAALNWETFGKFANGATQTVGGTVGQFTAGDGSQLSLSSLTVGGIIIPPDGSGGSYSGSFSTSLPPPDGCTTSVMPIIVSMCWTGSTFSMTYTSVCVSVPLGLLEGYEIVSRVTSWQWDGFNVIHYGCNGGWQFISRPGLEHHRIDSTFVSPCSATKNYTYNSGEWDFVAPTNCLAAPTDGWAMFADTNSWDYTCYEATTTNLMQPDRGLTFAVETNDVNCGGEAYVSNRMTETGSLTFRAPFYYPPNTPVLLTFEGMTTTNVVLHFGGTDVPPLSVDVGSGDVSFLVNVTGGLSYPINASSFTWPAASSSTTDGPDGYCFGDDGVHTRTFNSFSFTGFHNALPTCGPDVTDLVTNILSLVQAKWDSVWTNTFQRCAACASLHDIFDTVNNGLQFPGNREAGQAWDIFALKEIGFGEYNGFNNPPYRGEANTIYTNTVSFRGKCYFASAVNYSLWGKMNRLCSSFYLYPPYSNPFTLPKAEAATYLWKVMQYYSLGNTAILEAMSFTAIGYSGWNWIPSFSMPARFRSDPDNKNKITELPDKAGRWDPNWNAHPIGSHVQSWCSCQLPPF